MGLHITEISLRNFRNYDNLSLRSIGSLTIFIGNNAIGKTNLIEALQLCTALTSFRHPTNDQLVSDLADVSRLRCKIVDDYRDLELTAQIEHGKRKYLLNGKARSIADLKGTLPAVIFTPDDLVLVKKSSGVKRDALDELGSQLSKNYYIVKRDYDKVIRYKNRLLKEDASLGLIESINETLNVCGSQLECYRVELFKRLEPILKRNYARISNGEKLEIGYYPSYGGEKPIDINESLHKSDVEKNISNALNISLNEEIARKRSLVGPHADRIFVSINGKDAADYASQGQQRSIVLAWKLAEVDVIRESLGQSPILLLDDVMSELDASRRNALVSSVEGDVQTFITTTNLDYFDDSLISRAQVVHLPINGEVYDLAE